MAKVFKKKRDKGYTNIDNTLIRDESLSFKAKGLFAHLWSQADDWNFYVSEVAKHSVDGIDSVKSGLKELEQQGYVKRVHKQGEHGKFSGMDWILSDIGDLTINGNNHQRENPIDGETHLMDNPPLRTTNNKNYQSIKEITTKEHIGKAEPTDAPEVPYKEIVDYLNQKTRANFKSTARANQSLIKARFNEGYSLDDFKKVIDNKTDTWLNDNEMSKYLRPATLFGNKFDSYLNEKHKPLTAKEKDWGY